MTRWKAISLLVLSLALLLTACPDSDKSEGEADVEAFVLNLLEEETPEELTQAEKDFLSSDAVSDLIEDETSSDDVSDLIVETPSVDPLEDDNTFEETADDIAWQSAWTAGGACKDAKGDMGVVPKAMQVAVNASGDVAEVEVALCEPVVHPDIPFTHLYSGFFHCLNWLDFGTEYHAGHPATLGMVEAAYGMPHGTLYYIVRLPSDPWPSEIICEYGSVKESGDAFNSGVVKMQWNGPGPPGPSVPLPEDHSVPADATTLYP